MSKVFIAIALVATVLVASLTVLLEIFNMVAGWGIPFGRVEQLVLAIATISIVSAAGVVCWTVIDTYMVKYERHDS